MPDRFTLGPFSQAIPEPFYAEALPCESCGRPVERREWNQEHGLWIGTDCACNLPDEPVCPELGPAIMQARNVGEICRVIRDHRENCPLCGPKQARKEAKPPAQAERKAA